METLTDKLPDSMLIISQDIFHRGKNNASRDPLRDTQQIRLINIMILA